MSITAAIISVIIGIDNKEGGESERRYHEPTFNERKLL